MGIAASEALSALLDREGACTPLWASQLAAQLCRALYSAHEAGLVHGALEPVHVICGLGRTPELIEILEPDPPQDPSFSPTPQDDLRAVGAILREMLDEPLEDIAPELAVIVRRCVSPDPAQHYRSAKDLLEDLEAEVRLLERFQGAPLLPPPPPAGPIFEERPFSSTLELSAQQGWGLSRGHTGLLVGFLIALILGVVLMLRSDDAPSHSKVTPPRPQIELLRPIEPIGSVEQVESVQRTRRVVPKPVAVPVPQPVQIQLNSQPSGATVLLEGEPLGETPLTSSIDQARLPVTVELRLRGYLPLRKRIHNGAPHRFRLEPRHAPRPASRSPGRAGRAGRVDRVNRVNRVDRTTTLNPFAK